MGLLWVVVILGGVVFGWWYRRVQCGTTSIWFPRYDGLLADE